MFEAFSVPYLKRQHYSSMKRKLQSKSLQLCSFAGRLSDTEWYWLIQRLFTCHGRRAGMTFKPMTGNDNVTGSNAPVKLGSAPSDRRSVHDTRGFFGPTSPTHPSTTHYFSIPTPSQWLDQPGSPSHMAPHSGRQQWNFFFFTLHGSVQLKVFS